jgi:hypothetical protein
MGEQPADNLTCPRGHRGYAGDPAVWVGRDCGECGGKLSLLAEYRSASRVRPPSMFAFPRTVAGYAARTAALEELCRQTDELLPSSSRMGDGAGVNGHTS